jgi:hypothetical protein
MQYHAFLWTVVATALPIPWWEIARGNTTCAMWGSPLCLYCWPYSTLHVFFSKFLSDLGLRKKNPDDALTIWLTGNIYLKNTMLLEVTPFSVVEVYRGSFWRWIQYFPPKRLWCIWVVNFGFEHCNIKMICVNWIEIREVEGAGWILAHSLHANNSIIGSCSYLC